jgi:hypothetical protein
MTGGTALDGLDKETCLSKGFKGGVIRLIYINAFIVPEGIQIRLIVRETTWHPR